MELISESEEKSGSVDETCIIDEGCKQETHYTGVVFGKSKVYIDEPSGKDVSCTKKASGNDETCKEEEARPIDELSCVHLDIYSELRTTKDYRNIHSHCIAGTSIDELLWKYYHCFCYICETRFHRLHACLICPYFACYENNHIQEHCKESGHCLAVDITTGNIYCFLCKDYVYDHRYEHISRRQKENRGKYIASWFPTETVKLIDRHDVLISKDYLFQDPYVPKNIGEWQLLVEPGKLKFKFHVYFKKKEEGDEEEDEYEEYESYEDEEDEEKEKIVTEKIESTEENVENISQDITDVEISQIETLSLDSKPKSAKTRNRKSKGKGSKAKTKSSSQNEKRESKGKGSKAKTKSSSQNEKREEAIEMCDSEPLKGVFETVSEDTTGSVTPEILTSSSASKQIPQQKRRKVIKKRKIGLPRVEMELIDKEKFEAIVSRFMPKQGNKQEEKKEEKKSDIEPQEEVVESRCQDLCENVTHEKERKEQKKNDLKQQEGAVETRCQDLTENVTPEPEILKSILKQTSQPVGKIKKKKVSFNEVTKVIVLEEMSQDLAENEEILTLVSTPEPEIQLEKIKDEKKKETSDLKPPEEKFVIIRQGTNVKPSEENVIIMHEVLTDDEAKKGKQVIILKNASQDLTKCDGILKLNITPEYSAITYEDRKNELPEKILDIIYNNLPDDDAIMTLIPSSKPVLPKDREKGETEKEMETTDLNAPEEAVKTVCQSLAENVDSKPEIVLEERRIEEKMETCDLERPEDFIEMSKELPENKTPDTNILSSASKQTTRRRNRKKGRSRGKGFKRKSEETGILQTKTVTETPQTENSDSKSKSLQTKKKSQKAIEDKKPLPCTAKTIGLRGLVNLMNTTCYLNCVLQVLIHIPVLRNIFLSMRHNPVACRFTKIETMCLACEMYSLTQEFFSGEISPIVPAKIFYLIWKELYERSWKDPKLDSLDEQQDAHEILLLILQLLHEHMKSEDEDGNKCECYIHQLFVGVLQQEYCCLECGKKTITLEDFNNLSLTLGASSREAAAFIEELSLTECLNMYMGPEELEFSCANCEGETCKKITKVHTAPVVMCFHLNRSLSPIKKNETYVSFPERLDLFPYICEIPSEEEKDSSINEKEEGISTNEEKKGMSTNEEGEDMSTNEEGEDVSTNEEGEDMSTNEKREGMSTNQEGESMSTNQEGESMSTNQEGESMSTNQEGESMSTNQEEESMSTNQEGESMSTNQEGESMSTNQEGESVSTNQEGESMSTNQEGGESMSTNQEGKATSCVCVCKNMAVGEYSGKETSTRESENVCLEDTSKRNTRRKEFIPSFDEKLLQMGMNETTYSLISVIHHDGESGSGHYTAYIKMHGKWFLCDDVEVKEVDTTDVLNINAYLLFYQKDILHYEKKSQEELSKEMEQNNVIQNRKRALLEHLWRLVAFEIFKVKQ